MLLLFHNRLVNQAPLLVFFWIGCILQLVPTVSQGAEWTLKTSVDQSFGYDTNVRMQQDPQASFLYKIIPVLTAQHKTDNSQVTADASYGTQVYSDLPQFNRDIQNYSLSGFYNTERFDWGLAGNYSIAPARNTAVQNSGNFNSSSDRTLQSISPSVTYRIDETNSLSLTPSYSESSFSDAAASNFRNFTTSNISLAWQHSWTERYSTGTSFFYTNLDSVSGNANTVNGFKYDSIGLNVSNSYLWSETWTFAGTVGVRQTNSSGSSIGNSSSFGFLADVSANYSGESLSSGFNIKRSLVPSSQGQLLEQTGFSWDMDYNITDRLSADLNASYLNSLTISALSQKARENITIESAVHWKMSPEWKLTGSYRYRTQNSSLDNSGESTDKDADSSLIMLTINYNWQGLNISR